MPWFADRNSPTIAPASASDMAIFRPAMMMGVALGSCSFQKIWLFVAPSERNISLASSSTLSMPVTVLTKGGKKQISAAMAIFGLHPKPSQAIRIGVSATRGVTCGTRM